jgi:RNA polymerase sigma factor (TIGR02999 family)
MTSGKTGVAEITRLLQGPGAGRVMAEELLPLVYKELRSLARSRLSKLKPGQTLGATDLVHEVWMKVVGTNDPGWDKRAHFFGAAANAMREILVDQARRRTAGKRNVARREVLPTDLPEVRGVLSFTDVLTVHEALTELEQQHARPGKVVLLRFFAGMSMPEIAEMLQVSVPTVERDWRFARAWLQQRMGGPANDTHE